MIAHVLTFAAHRRTLVVLAFGRHGIEELGWGDPMRWVARAAPETRRRHGPTRRRMAAVEIAAAARRPGSRACSRSPRWRTGSTSPPAAADRGRRRGVVPPGRAGGPPRARGGAARAAAAAALRGRDPDLARRLQRQPSRDPAALGRAGRVHDAGRRRDRARVDPRHLLAGRRSRSAPSSRRPDAVAATAIAPADRAAPPGRDDPRGRVAAQRRDRAGRAAHARSPPPSVGVVACHVGADFLLASRGRRPASASSSSSSSPGCAS